MHDGSVIFYLFFLTAAVGYGKIKVKNIYGGAYETVFVSVGSRNDKLSLHRV